MLLSLIIEIEEGRDCSPKAFAFASLRDPCFNPNKLHASRALVPRAHLDGALAQVSFLPLHLYLNPPNNSMGAQLHDAPFPARGVCSYLGPILGLLTIINKMHLKWGCAVIWTFAPAARGCAIIWGPCSCRTRAIIRGGGYIICIYITQSTNIASPRHQWREYLRISEEKMVKKRVGAKYYKAQGAL